MAGYNHGAGGRPPHKRDEKLAAKVKMLSAMLGANAREIGLVMGLSAPTVLKYYRYEYEVGTLEATANVAQSLYRAATDAKKPNVIACIFYLKCRGGWSETGGEPPPGKKETADLLARVAEKDTTWEGLLSGPTTTNAGAAGSFDDSDDDRPEEEADRRRLPPRPR
jgi:hypothetical protein